MRRPRGPGGRFLTGEEIRALEQQEQEQGQQQQQQQQQQPQPSQQQQLPQPQQSSRPQSANGTNGNAKTDPVSTVTEGAES